MNLTRIFEYAARADRLDGLGPAPAAPGPGSYPSYSSIRPLVPGDADAPRSRWRSIGVIVGVAAVAIGIAIGVYLARDDTAATVTPVAPGAKRPEGASHPRRHGTPGWPGPRSTPSPTTTWSPRRPRSPRRGGRPRCGGSRAPRGPRRGPGPAGSRGT